MLPSTPRPTEDVQPTSAIMSGNESARRHLTWTSPSEKSAHGWMASPHAYWSVNSGFVKERTWAHRFYLRAVMVFFDAASSAHGRARNKPVLHGETALVVVVHAAQSSAQVLHVSRDDAEGRSYKSRPRTMIWSLAR